MRHDTFYGIPLPHWLKEKICGKNVNVDTDMRELGRYAEYFSNVSMFCDVFDAIVYVNDADELVVKPRFKEFTLEEQEEIHRELRKLEEIDPATTLALCKTLAKYKERIGEK